MRRHRRRVTVITTILALAAAITVHHSALPVHTDHDVGVSAVAELCLGVFTAVGVALMAAGFAILARGRWSPASMLLPAPGLPARRVPPARARHGPGLLLMLCVSRR